jgi:hypothetical protein
MSTRVPAFCLDAVSRMVSHCGRLGAIATLVSAFLPFAASVAAIDLCPGFALSQEISPPLTESEKLLVCGNPELEDSRLGSWSEIPKAQAILHLRAFLQLRGHLQPEFHAEEGRTFVEPGPVTRITAVELDPTAALGLDLSRRRKIVGAPLSPTILNELEEWGTRELQKIGYPCPVVTTAADSRSGRVRVSISPGERTAFAPVELPDISPLDSRVLRRYFAFQTGEPFDITLINATEDRIITEGLLERIEIVPDCRTEGAPLRHMVTVGEPRLLLFSLGLNTEVIAELRAQWKYARIAPKGSQAEVGLLASTRLQQAHLRYRWFFGRPGSRGSLEPAALVRRQSEAPFSQWTQQAELLFATHWDNPSFSTRLRAGPQFAAFQLQRGPFGERDSHALSAKAELDLQSHRFEPYRWDLPPGFRLNASLQASSPLSSFSARILRLEGSGIWNFRDYHPPLFSLRFRGAFASTSVPARDREILPASLRQYLGGNESVRGFGRLGLPFQGPGALTSAYLGLELLPDLFGETLSPKVFADAGMLGQESLRLDAPVFWSPGAGLDWRSPLGPAKATLARGLGASPQWTIFLGLGGGF